MKRILILVLLGCGPATGLAAQEVRDSLALRIFPLPFLFYQPETKFGGGLGLLATWRAAPGSRSSSANILGAYTQLRQFTILTQLEYWTAANRWRIGGEGAFSRFPDLFYGVGNSTREADEEDFTLQHLRLQLDVRRAIGPSVYAGLTAGLMNTRRREIVTGGMLDTGSIAGSAGGTIAALGVVAARDTRDNSFATRSGSYAAFTVRRAGLFGDYNHTRSDFDARAFTTRGPHTLALQLIGTASAGDPPFYDMGTLGGSNVLRGYFEGRYRAANRTVLQAEWRFPVWRRFSGVAFAGAGEVMHSWSDFTLSGLHPAAGAGVRFMISPQERINLRIDYGVGRGYSGLYFALGEAF